MIDEAGCLVEVCSVAEVVWEVVAGSSPGMQPGSDTAPSLTSLGQMALPLEALGQGAGARAAAGVQPGAQ